MEQYLLRAARSGLQMAAACLALAAAATAKAAPGGTLRFGDIDTEILSGTVVGTEFSGTIRWGPLDTLVVNNLVVIAGGPGILTVTSGSVALPFP